MIIQCEQCQTKFRLDDSKVKDSGVKVRCARCRHVFSVSKEQQESTPTSDFGLILDQNVALVDEAQAANPFDTLEETVPAETPTGSDFDSSSFAAEEQVESTTTVDSSMFDLPDEEELPAEETPDFSQFAQVTDQDTEMSADDAPAQETGNILGGFDFGAVEEFDEESAEESAQFSDFADESAAPLDVNVQLGDFADAAALPETDDGSELGAGLAADEHFNMGEIDFGDDLAALSSQQVNPDDSKDALDFDFSHLDEPLEQPTVFANEASSSWAAQPTTGVIGAAATATAAGQAKSASVEQPPLPIASRRKPVLLMPVLLSAAAIIGMAAMIYMGNSKPAEETAKPAAVAGNITLSAVDAVFINNKTAGELLVISGTAANNFAAPRAAVQIKGMVYGDKDQVLTSKTAFCGNTLTTEQLSTMPLKTIEAAMANQFGSSLDNLEVAPGKSIPCMVVISKVPEDSKNYGAVLAGSTPVTPKQK